MDEDRRAKARFGSDGLCWVHEVREGWFFANAMFGCDNGNASADEWGIPFLAKMEWL